METSILGNEEWEGDCMRRAAWVGFDCTTLTRGLGAIGLEASVLAALEGAAEMGGGGRESDEKGSGVTICRSASSVSTLPMQSAFKIT